MEFWSEYGGGQHNNKFSGWKLFSSRNTPQHLGLFFIIGNVVVKWLCQRTAICNSNNDISDINDNDDNCNLQLRNNNNEEEEAAATENTLNGPVVLVANNNNQTIRSNLCPSPYH